MAEITAAQFIFGTLPGDLSPKRRSGHCLIARTPGAFSKADLEHMERRLYLDTQMRAVKNAYFSLPNGGLGVARVTPIEVAGNDRRGGYLAHALVLSRRDMSTLGFDPFPLLDKYRFEDSTDFVRERVEEPIDAPAVTLPTPLPHSPGPWRAVLGDAIEDLVLLALRAPALRRERRKVVLVGSPEWATDVLRALFHVLPPQNRLSCTFDTWAGSRDLGGTDWWAVCVPVDQQPPTTAIPYQQGSRGPVLPKRFDPADRTEQYVLQELRAGRTPTHDEVSTVRTVTAWTAGSARQAPPDVREMLEDDRAPVVRELLHTERLGFQRKAREQLETRAGERLAWRLWEWAYAYIQHDQSKLLSCAMDGFPEAEVDAWVLNVCRHPEFRREVDDYLDRTLPREASSPPTRALVELLVCRRSWTRLGAVIASLDLDDPVLAPLVTYLENNVGVELQHEVQGDRVERRSTGAEFRIVTTVRARDERSDEDVTELLERILVPTGHSAPHSAGPLSLRIRPTSPVSYDRVSWLLRVLTSRQTSSEGPPADARGSGHRS